MTLHLVTGSDDNYVAGVLVLIASASFHTPDLRATVLDNGISPENRARIDALGAHLGIRLDRIEIGKGHFDTLPVVRKHLTRSTYLRLLIPDLLPDAERVVYMDCDMVVCDDLTPLADMPLDDAMVAAVPCPSPDALEIGDTGVAAGDYVNAGLLVMNLPVWRNEAVAERCIALLSGSSRTLLSEDQSALNIAARGRIVPLSGRFNVYADPSAYSGPTPLPGDLAVIHYVVRMKPWAGAVPMGEVWHYHADRIAAFMPPITPPSLSSRMSAWNRRRRALTGLALRKPRYLRQQKLRRDMTALARANLDKIARAD